MHIEKALQLKKGDVVEYPPDRENLGGYSKVKYVQKNQEIKKNINGISYIWVHLECGGVWPSNRLR